MSRSDFCEIVEFMGGANDTRWGLPDSNPAGHAELSARGRCPEAGRGAGVENCGPDVGWYPEIILIGFKRVVINYIRYITHDKLRSYIVINAI